jgi:hypothetical protein
MCLSVITRRLSGVSGTGYKVFRPVDKRWSGYYYNRNWHASFRPYEIGSTYVDTRSGYIVTDKGEIYQQGYHIYCKLQDAIDFLIEAETIEYGEGCIFNVEYARGYTEGIEDDNRQIIVAKEITILGAVTL